MRARAPHAAPKLMVGTRHLAWARRSFAHPTAPSRVSRGRTAIHHHHQDAIMAKRDDVDWVAVRYKYEHAARALAALTRTLRELKAFQTHPEEPQADDTVDDIDEFRRALARKIDALVASHGGDVRDDPEREGT